ncbi:YncE family protein [Rhodohalobacter sp. 614A]|uniref:YncE family protein n=1 Tax=Rhodohalobacter sp. 614A TaxID=2908649 RepID=UPI001F2AA0DE|nr:YncE family protein [Rhodohalobacter sp. 614A]
MKIVQIVSLLCLMALTALTAHAQTISKTTKVAPGIYEIIHNQTTDEIYIASAGSRSNPVSYIYVLDAETLAKKDSIDVQPHRVFGLGFNQKTQTLYTSNTVSNSVYAIDVSKKEVVATITPDKEESHTREIVVDEENNLVYVTDVGSPGSVWVIDGSSNTLDRIIENTGETTTGIAFNKEKNLLYLTNMGSNEIAVLDINTDKVVQNYSSHSERPTNVEFDPETDRLFVANQGTNDVTVLNATTGELIKTIETGEGALGIRFDPKQKRIYVANRGAGTVTVIDSESYGVLANLETGTHPNTVAINPDSGAAFVTNKAKSGQRGSSTPPPPDPNGDTVTKITP